MELIDRYGRRITYLRVSVTDRCNLACRYCMIPGRVRFIPPERLLTDGEICEFVRVAVSMGMKKVRLTGGEPLVRPGIVALVEKIASIGGIEDFAMTTNGIFLSRYAQSLADAGLMRVNVSLDTLDADKYRWITRGGDIKDVLEGIKAAERAGLTPIKLNCVVDDFTTHSDIEGVREFARRNGYIARFIRRMRFETGEFHIVQGGDGGNCPICNRLRLTPDGFIKPCLFNDIKFSIRELGYERAIIEAVKNKPRAGTFSKTHEFYNIGG